MIFGGKFSLLHRVTKTKKQMLCVCHSMYGGLTFTNVGHFQSLEGNKDPQILVGNFKCGVESAS